VPCRLAGLVRSGDPVERFWVNDAKAHRASLVPQLPANLVSRLRKRFRNHA
jgi:hypothetical protein